MYADKTLSNLVTIFKKLRLYSLYNKLFFNVHAHCNKIPSYIAQWKL